MPLPQNISAGPAATLPEGTPLLEGIHYNGPPEHTDQWNLFTRIYTNGGESEYKIKVVNQLDEIVFGKGLHAILQEMGFPEKDGHIITQTEDQQQTRINQRRLQMLKQSLEDACRAQSELTREEAPRALNHAIIDGLMEQWIGLEKQAGLYPPVKIPPGDAEIAIAGQIKERRRDLLQSSEGMLLSGALRMINNALIESKTYEIYINLPQSRRGKYLRSMPDEDSKYDYTDALGVAQDKFESSLFLYNPAHESEAMFSTYLTESLGRSLRRNLLKEVGKPATSLEIDEDGEMGLYKAVANPKSINSALADTNIDLQSKMSNVIGRLSERDLDIVSSFFMLNGAEYRTLEDSAKKYDIKRQRAAQIKDRFVQHVCDAHGIPLPEKRKQISAPQDVLDQKHKLRAYFSALLGEDFALKTLADAAEIEPGRIASLIGVNSLSNPKTAGSLADTVRDKLVQFLSGRQQPAEVVAAFIADFEHMRELCGHKGSSVAAVGR